MDFVGFVLRSTNPTIPAGSAIALHAVEIIIIIMSMPQPGAWLSPCRFAND